jgi:hypothetical protein
VHICPIIKIHLFRQGGSPAPHRGSPAREAIFSKAGDIEPKHLVERYGTKDWVMIAHIMTTKRSSRQCRVAGTFIWLRRLIMNRGPPWTAMDHDGPPWTATDDELLLEQQKQIGSKWSELR